MDQTVTCTCGAEMENLNGEFNWCPECGQLFELSRQRWHMPNWSENIARALRRAVKKKGVLGVIEALGQICFEESDRFESNGDTNSARWFERIGNYVQTFIFPKSLEDEGKSRSQKERRYEP